MTEDIVPLIKPLKPTANHICYDCGSTENLTKHHIEGNGKGPSVWLCRPCHDRRHDMIPNKERTPEQKAERAYNRAQKRISRDVNIMQKIGRPWIHIADRWTLEEKREMYRYLEDFLLRERDKELVGQKESEK
jgi:hypothetical protein